MKKLFNKKITRDDIDDEFRDMFTNDDYDDVYDNISDMESYALSANEYFEADYIPEY